MTRALAHEDDTPQPAPASEERPTEPASTRVAVDADPIERFAHCRSVEELPAELQENPFIRYLMSLTPEEQAREEAADAAHREAEALYGDDPELILAAIEAGQHPLQQRAPSDVRQSAPRG
jgi:hypothetical protein